MTHGHTVFAISYVNPGPEHRDTGFEDYLRAGPLAALDVVEAITGAEKINVGALSLGGTLGSDHVPATSPPRATRASTR